MNPISKFAFLQKFIYEHQKLKIKNKNKRA